GVAKPLGHLVDDAVDDPLLLGLAFGKLGPGKQRRRMDGAAPGAEMLGAEFGADSIAYVTVDVVGAQLAPLAILVEILEQLLSGNILGAAHDPGDAPVDQFQLPFLAGFALEGKPQAGSSNLDMAVTQCGEPKTLVVARI